MNSDWLSRNKDEPLSKPCLVRPQMRLSLAPLPKHMQGLGLVPNATPLPARDQHHLRAAEGWLELGDWRSANEELESVTAALRAHPDVLAMRWQV
jgi:hypothetical protein